MATSLAVKRMARERVTLEKPNPDYFVSFKDDNLLRFEVYVIGPADTLYSHKFVKLRFEIPPDYPLKPPKCKFLQHTGGRIHPNLYTDGKVCLSILGTWQGEPWALAMTCETVLITIRSLLDNSPYKHEPGQRDHPAFNAYVQYSTWKCLLLDYLRNETDPVLKSNLEECVSKDSDQLLQELDRQHTQNKRTGTRSFTSPYSGHASVVAVYDTLIRDISAACKTLKPKAIVETPPTQDISHKVQAPTSKPVARTPQETTEQTTLPLANTMTNGPFGFQFQSGPMYSGQFMGQVPRPYLEQLPTQFSAQYSNQYTGYGYDYRFGYGSNAVPTGTWMHMATPMTAQHNFQATLPTGPTSSFPPLPEDRARTYSVIEDVDDDDEDDEDASEPSSKKNEPKTFIDLT